MVQSDALQTRVRTPKADSKPKHRRSGSVSSISITANDLIASTGDGGDLVTPGFISSRSLKNKMPKRRTRSSLGGAEELLKDFEFLTASPVKKSALIAPRNLTGETPKAELASEAYAPVHEETSAAALKEEAVEDSPTGLTIVSAQEDCAGVEANGTSHVCELLSSVGEESAGVCRECSVKSDGGEIDSRGVMGSYEEEIGEEAGKPDDRNLLSSSASDKDIDNVSEMFCNLDVDGPSGNQEGSEGSKAVQEALDRKREEKVSVQRRIEELERIAGGKPVHFRSQSLSLPRPSDVLHSRHHEAEGRRGVRLPQYKAPLDCVVAEVCSADSTEMSGRGELSQEDVTDGNVPFSGAAPLRDPEIHGSGPCDRDSELQNGSETLRLEDLRVTNVIGESGLNFSSVDGTQVLNSAGVLVIGNVTEPVLVEKSGDSDCGSPSKVSRSENESLCIKDVFVNRSDGTGNGTSGDTHLAVDSRPEIIYDYNKLDVVHLEERKVSAGESPIYPHPFKSLSAHTDTEPCVESELREETNAQVAALENEEVALVEKDSKGLDLNADSVHLGNGAYVGEDPFPGIAHAVLSKAPSVTNPIPGNGEADNLATDVRSLIPGECVSAEASQTPISSLVTFKPPERSYQDEETSVLLTKQPAVDPLFVDSQLDRLWEMHSQELSTRREGDSSTQEVRESSAREDDPIQYGNAVPVEVEVSTASCSTNGNGPCNKSNKIDRPRTPLRSLLAEEEAAEKGSEPDLVARSSTSQNTLVSPRGNLFRRIVSGGRSSPGRATAASEFSPKNETSSRPFLSSCICCPPVK